MAIKAGGLGWKKAVGGRIAVVTISGTVQSGGSAASRDILIYKYPFNDLSGQATSDSSGNFSILVNGGSNDCFRVICVGIAGENSVVYERVCS